MNISTNGSTSTKTYKFIDLFAGIGGIRIAFEKNRCECVFSSEWDKFAQETYEANFGEKPKGDITKINSDDIPDHDILTAGFPCQPFSIIGKRNGFDDERGNMFFEIERILNDKEPYAFLLENVKMLKGLQKGKAFKVIKNSLIELGYFVHYKILNALDFGLPQKRERIFIVGFKKNHPFKFPTAKELNALKLEDVLEPNDKVDDKYFIPEDLKEEKHKKVSNLPKHRTIWHENKSGNIGVNDFSCALRAGASYNYLLVDGVRRPTEREHLRLQGFPEDFKIPVSYTQLRKQAGNSVPVPVVEQVAKSMIEAMSKEPVSGGFIKQKEMELK